MKLKDIFRAIGEYFHVKVETDTLDIYNIAEQFDKLYDEALEPGGPDDFLTETDLVGTFRAYLPDNLTDKYNVMRGCKYTMISHHPELQWMGDVLYGARHIKVPVSVYSNGL